MINLLGESGADLNSCNYDLVRIFYYGHRFLFWCSDCSTCTYPECSTCTLSAAFPQNFSVCCI